MNGTEIVSPNSNLQRYEQITKVQITSATALHQPDLNQIPCEVYCSKGIEEGY